MPRPFLPPLRPDEIAEKLPQYHSFQPVAEGGQGCVFRAQDPNDQSVAVKVFSPRCAEVRVEREIRKLRMISSNYVVKLLDFGRITVRSSKVIYSVTPFEEGYDLRRYLQTHGPLSESQCINLLYDVGRAIDDLWAVRVVHRDLKPENILTQENGHYLVVDLGLAKHLDEDTITLPGLVVGTPGYIAPEQFRRKSVTIRADLFSLGVVAYEALTGVHPFSNNQPVLQTSSSQAALPLGEHLVDHARLARTLMKLLDFNPLRRPASGHAVALMLGGGTDG